MMTADYIEALRAKLREVNDLDGLQRLGHELLLHAPELLARAAAFERVAVVALGNFGAPEIGLAAYRVVRDFDAAAAKGFKP